MKTPLMTALFALLIALSVGCNDLAPAAGELAKQERTVETKTQTDIKTTTSKNTATDAITIRVANNELAADTHYKFRESDSVEIAFGGNEKYTVWERHNGQLADTPRYSITTDHETRKIWVSLKEFAENTEWFITTGGVESRNFVVNSNIAQFSESTDPAVIRPAKLRIYAATSEQPAKLLTQIDVLHTPFSLHVLLRKPGEDHFANFTGRTDIPRGTELKMMLNSHEATHMGIFLCYMKDEQPEKILRIFPDPDVAETPKVSPQSSLQIPAQEKTIALEDEQGEAVIYCFATEKAHVCEELRDWLSYRTKGYQTIVGLNHGEVVRLGEGETEIPYTRINLAKRQ